MQIQSRALCVKCLVDGELPRERKGLSLRYRTRIPLLNNEEAITSLLSQQPPEFCILFGGIFQLFNDNEGVFYFTKDPETTKGGLFFMQQNFSKTHRLVIMALLVAISIILSRFLSIAAWNLKIGFAFVPVALAGMILGPIPAAIVAAVADFLGAILFPIGQFFPGFTLTAFLNGLLYGIFLYKKADMKSVVLSAVITQILGSLLLNTFWISMLYGTPFWALLPTRIMQVCFMTVVEIIVIRIMACYAPKIYKTQKA